MKNKMSELAKISKEYKYTKDEFLIITTIACSSQMYDNGYSSEQAIEKTIEYIENSKNANVTINKLLTLSGYKD